jgi:sacsin
LKEWPTLRQHEGLVAVLKETPFVPVGRRLLRPREVLDPRVDVLSYIFGGEEVFPDSECSGEEWLTLLAALGMKTSIDRESFLECARKVQQLAGGQPFGNPRVACGALSPDVLSRAMLLARHLVEHFGALTATDDDEVGAERRASDFCATLGRLRFVPSNEPLVGVGPHAGEPTLACFAELALNQDRHLVWTEVPLLKRDLTPPRTSWQDLGLLHPPPATTVLSHGLSISQHPPDQWPYSDDPSDSAEAVFGAIWAHFGERWLSMPHDVRARLSTMRLLLCGTSFVPPRRVFRSVFATCQPLLQPVSAISSTPAPSDQVLMAVGVSDEPSLPSLARILRELPAECGGARLTPSERRALISILRLASDFRGFSADGKFAVPTQGGLAVCAERCVISDSPWILRRMRPGVVHLASDAIDSPLRAKLQLKKLSDVVKVRLAPGFEPRLEGTCDDLAAAELTSLMHSMDFAAAASSLLGAHAGWRDPSLSAPPRHLRTEAIATALRPFSVTLVRRLRTRLVLGATGEDVTAELLAEEEDDEPWFVERTGKEILILAELPAGLSRELLLAQAVCELVGSDSPASLAPLLASPAARITTTLEALRVSPPLQWATASASGAPGTPCSAEDEAMLHLVPLRPYFTGEVVAVDGNRIGRPDDNGLVYAEIDTSTTSGQNQLSLRVGGAVIRCLALDVHSFCSQLRTTAGRRPDTSGALAEEDHVETTLEDEASRQEADGSGSAPPSGPSSAELVDAVSSVLRRAGVPIGLETKQLLEANLQLQAELASTKAELEDARIESSRAREQFEVADTAITCQVCMTRRVDLLLNGCGHMLCSTCAARMQQCPFCRRPLTEGTARLRW